MKKSVLPKPLLCISLALTLLFGSFSTVQAADFPKSWPQAPGITEETGVLMEASTGQILFDKSMDEIGRASCRERV